MFIATTDTPTKEANKEKINSDVSKLYDRIYDYLTELEKLEKIKTGSPLEIYNKCRDDIINSIDNNWVDNE